MVSSQSCSAMSPGRKGSKRELALHLWCSEATCAGWLRAPHQGPRRKVFPPPLHLSRRGCLDPGAEDQCVDVSVQS